LLKGSDHHGAAAAGLVFDLNGLRRPPLCCRNLRQQARSEKPGKLCVKFNELGGPRHRGSGVARATDGVGILLLGHIRLTGTCIAPSLDPGCTYGPCRVVPLVTGTKDVKVRRIQGDAEKERAPATVQSLMLEEEPVRAP